ncbi:MAG TPA: TetR/AcrR family transcriptional regulator [bacterium]|nr:TetR/AcrR family transcriptional regulator [bacterium]
MAEDTRELVVAEAKRLFYQYGFRRITMDEIAANLRMSKKTLYALFPSKEELVRAVILTIMAPKMARMKGLMQGSGTVAEFFGGVVEVFHALGREVSEPMMLDMKMSPDIWKEIEERRLETLSHIGEVIERGKKTGEVRADLNVDLFLRVFMLVINRIGNPTMMLELNMKPSELAGQLFGIFFHGIVPADRRAGGVS